MNECALDINLFQGSALTRTALMIKVKQFNVLTGGVEYAIVLILITNFFKRINLNNSKAMMIIRLHYEKKPPIMRAVKTPLFCILSIQ